MKRSQRLGGFAKFLGGRGDLVHSSLARPADTVTASLMRWRWWLLAIGLLSLPPLIWLGQRLQMNRSLAALFTPGDAALVDYQDLQTTFGGNLIVMIVYGDNDLKTADGLARNRQWSNQAEQIEGVDGVLSVAKLTGAFSVLRPPSALSFFGSSAPPADADVSVPLFDANDPLAVDFLELFSGYTHNTSGDTAAIVAMLNPDSATAAVAGLRRLAEMIPPSHQAVVVGEPVLLEDAFDLIETDGQRLAAGTLGLLSVVILLSLRDLRVVVLSLLSIAWANAATRCVMIAMGIELSLVSTILMAIITVIVVAAVMHLGLRNRERLREIDVEQPSAPSAWRTLAWLFFPIGWTCATDAAGFASLLVSGVRPVGQFGGMTAIAAVLVAVSLALFAPAILSVRTGALLFRTKRLSASGNSHMLWDIVTTAIRHRVSLVVASLVLLAVSGWEVTRLETKASFLSNFRDNSEIVRAYERVERRLGGAGVWDVVVPAPAIITTAYAAAVRELEDDLRRVTIDDSATGEAVGLTKVLSLMDADAVAARSPLLQLAGPEIRLAGMRAALPTFADALLTFPNVAAADPERNRSEQNNSGQAVAPESRKLRIMLRSREDLSAKSKRALIAQVQQIVRDWSAGDMMVGDVDEDPVVRRGVVTGYSVLMSRLVDSLIGDQWRALGVAMLSVGGLLWLATRSLPIAIAALLVNTLPIFVVLAVIGRVGGQLDLGSAMIGAVSIGLSIDGSVHLLAGVARRRADGASAASSAIDAATDLGTPILLATGALIVGFGVLITSPFVPTSTFGVMVSATLAVSAITNLTLFPALLSFWKTNDA